MIWESIILVFEEEIGEWFLYKIVFRPGDRCSILSPISSPVPCVDLSVKSMDRILNKEELEKIRRRTELSIQRTDKEAERELRQLIRLGVLKLVDGFMAGRINDSGFFRQLQNYMYCLEILNDEPI